MVLKQNEFYCVSCRKAVRVSNEDMCVKEFKNKRAKTGKTPALVGTCNKCSHKVVKFIKRDDVKKLKAKVGTC